MMIGWIVGLAILAFLIWIIPRTASGAGPGSREESAEEILKKRYARGEIDEEQFQRMKDELQRR